MIGEYTPQIRYNNRTAFGNGPYSFVPLRQVTGPGYYYFAIQRSAEKAGEDSAAPVTVRIRVAVEGSVTGTPTYAGPSPDVAASPTASPTASPSRLPVVLAVLGGRCDDDRGDLGRRRSLPARLGRCGPGRPRRARCGHGWGAEAPEHRRLTRVA